VTFAPELLRAGVRGILTPAEAPNLLVWAIQTIQAGQRFLSPSVATALLEVDQRPLSRAELRVVALLAQGHGTDGIAEEMGICRRSAQNYITALRRKLGCRERVQLAAWYQRYMAG
jgi:two-component system response regulator DesR